jgi:DNA-binding transcriptional ArsR family regulator
MHALDALGNPVRREILVRLRAKPATVGEIAARFPVSRPAISRHLAMLQRAGLVTSRAAGARTLYAVRLEGFAPVRAYLDGFWDTALARLEQLAKKSGTDDGR